MLRIAQFMTFYITLYLLFKMETDAIPNQSENRNYIYPSWNNYYFHPYSVYYAQTQVEKYVRMLNKSLGRVYVQINTKSSFKAWDFSERSSFYSYAIGFICLSRSKYISEDKWRWENIENNDDNANNEKGSLEDLIGIEINSSSFKRAISMIHEWLEEQEK